MAEVNLEIVGLRYDTATDVVILTLRRSIPPAPDELSDLWFPETPTFEVDVQISGATTRGQMETPTATYLRDEQLWRIEYVDGSWNMPGVPVEEQP